MTEKYPRGMLNENDEGVLNIAMGMKDGTFIIDFGKEVTWIGMSKDEAFDFARAIMKHCADRVITAGKKP